jgi:Mrp family chromosome partitioning ATPase
MPMTSTVESETAAGGAFEQILGQVEAATQGLNRARVLGITGCKSGDGATFVFSALARRLAERSRKRVLQANCDDLFMASRLLMACRLLPSELLAQCTFTEQAGLWHLSSERALSSRCLEASPQHDLKATMAVLDSRFDFVLLDCGAVNTSGRLWQLAPIVDDVLLVVAAGETKRSQVNYAQRLIARSGVHLSGCVLNKRTYPLPDAIHRMLN